MRGREAVSAVVSFWGELVVAATPIAAFAADDPLRSLPSLPPACLLAPLCCFLLLLFSFFLFGLLLLFFFVYDFVFRVLCFVCVLS